MGHRMTLSYSHPTQGCSGIRATYVEVDVSGLSWLFNLERATIYYYEGSLLPHYKYPG